MKIKVVCQDCGKTGEVEDYSEYQYCSMDEEEDDEYDCGEWHCRECFQKKIGANKMALPIEPTPELTGDDAKRFIELLDSEPTETQINTYKTAMRFYKEHKIKFAYEANK